MTERIVDLEPEVLRDARERAAELIRCGFLEQAEVLVDSFDDQGLDGTAPSRRARRCRKRRATSERSECRERGASAPGQEPRRRAVESRAALALVRPLWEARPAEQRAWPEPTDVDRLGLAFDLLEHQGRRRDGLHLLLDLRLRGDRRRGGREHPRFRVLPPAGHRAGAAGQGLLLRYGAFGTAGEADGAVAAVGREVVAGPAESGLGAEWDGSARSAIRVTPLEWLNRLPE